MSSRLGSTRTSAPHKAPLFALSHAPGLGGGQSTGRSAAGKVQACAGYILRVVQGPDTDIVLTPFEVEAGCVLDFPEDGQSQGLGGSGQVLGQPRVGPQCPHRGMFPVKQCREKRREGQRRGVTVSLNPIGRNPRNGARCLTRHWGASSATGHQRCVTPWRFRTRSDSVRVYSSRSNPRFSMQFQALATWARIHAGQTGPGHRRDWWPWQTRHRFDLWDWRQ